MELNMDKLGEHSSEGEARKRYSELQRMKDKEKRDLETRRMKDVIERNLEMWNRSYDEDKNCGEYRHGKKR